MLYYFGEFYNNTKYGGKAKVTIAFNFDVHSSSVIVLPYIWRVRKKYWGQGCCKCTKMIRLSYCSTKCQSAANGLLWNKAKWNIPRSDTNLCSADIILLKFVTREDNNVLRYLVTYVLYAVQKQQNRRRLVWVQERPCPKCIADGSP